MCAFQTAGRQTYQTFSIQCLYNKVYDNMYDTAYNQAFIFYDEDEELCMDEFIYCAKYRRELLATSFTDRQIS